MSTYVRGDTCLWIAQIGHTLPYVGYLQTHDIV